MAINIVNEKIRSNNINIDANYGPYDSVQEAHSSLLDNNKNKVGVTVGIKDNTTQTIEEYWYQGGTEQANLVKKQTTVEVDVTPTQSSPNAVSSGGVYTALQGKAPSTNIQKQALASDVQNSLGKADTALQSFTETDPTVPAWAKQSTKPSYDYSEINNTPDLSGFITKSVNDLANYYLKSETYTKDEVATLIGAIQQFHYEIYATLPQTGQGNVLYLIGPTGSGSDRYEEYVYVNNAWNKIGDTSIDLSGYVTTSALNTALAGYTTTESLTTLLAGKQDTIQDLQQIRTRADEGHTALQPKQSGQYTQGNIVVFDANGGLADSQKKTSDFATTEQGAKADTALQPSDLKTINSQSIVGSGNITVEGGTDDYADLDNKPQINSVTLSGNKSASDLGLATAAQGALAASAYQKPQTGIPSTDLASGVQTSLGKANTAVQQVTVGTTTTGNAGAPASVVNSGTSTAPVLDFTIPRGADAVNPFKGWFDAVVTGEASSRVITSEIQNLPENPVVGDYAYVKTWEISGTAPSQTETPIAKIYECATDGTWSDSGRIADTSNVQTFASGEKVNEIFITGAIADNNKLPTAKAVFDELYVQGEGHFIKTPIDYVNNPNNSIISNQGKWVYSVSGNYSVSIELPTGLEQIRIVRGDSAIAIAYAFLVTNNCTGHNVTADLATGYTKMVVDDTHSEIIVNVPSDAHYLVLTRSFGGSSYEPKLIEGVGDVAYIEKYLERAEYNNPELVDFNLDNVIFNNYKDCIASTLENKWFTSTADVQTVMIDLKGITKLSIKKNPNYDISFTFLKSKEYTVGNIADLATGYSTIVTQSSDADGLTVPSDAKYLYMVWVWVGNSYRPSHIYCEGDIVTEPSLRNQLFELIGENGTSLQYEGERINVDNQYNRSVLFDWASISNTSVVTNVYAQGMDIYEKYLIQAMGENSNKAAGIAVIDIETKSVLGYMTFNESNCHSNNLIVSSEKYSDSDTLPLIYFSQSTGDHKCYVVRIANTFDSYTIIQTITYSGTHHQNASHVDWYLGDDGYLYTFGVQTDGQTYTGPFEMLKFTLPSTSNSVVQLTDSDIVDTYSLVNVFKIWQGERVINGKLFLPYGFGGTYQSTYPSGLVVYDLNAKRVVSRITDFIYGEPEAVSVYGGKLIVVQHGGDNPTYYQFTFK